MKLSTKGRYGLRAMIDLAEFSEAEPVSIASISQRQGISQELLEDFLKKQMDGARASAEYTKKLCKEYTGR